MVHHDDDEDEDEDEDDDDDECLFNHVQSCSGTVGQMQQALNRVFYTYCRLYSV